MEGRATASKEAREPQLGGSRRGASPPAQSPLTGLGNQTKLRLLHLLRDGRVQRKRAASNPGAALADAPPPLGDALASGRPLERATRERLEPRLGIALDQVRVHTDARAAESARLIDARAYTVGADIVFGAGEYAPGSAEGEHLLAHELAHVAQQAAGASSRVRLEPLEGATPQAPDDPLERHADTVADSVIAGRSATSLLARAPALGRPNGVPKLQMKGKAKAASPKPPVRTSDLVASEQLVNFGDSEIKMPTMPRAVQITNAGGETIGALEIEKLGPNADQFFVVVGDGPIKPGGSVTLGVDFVPDGFGNRSCLVRVASRDPSAETYVMVRGIGIDAWWRAAIEQYANVESQTGHGYEHGDRSFYRFLEMGNEQRHLPPVSREAANMIETMYGFPSPPSEEELARREKEAAARGPFVPPPQLHWDSQGRIGTAEELRSIHFIEDLEAMDNLKSLGGDIGYGVSGLWTDDPRERMEWARLGNITGNVVGAVASPYGARMGPGGGAPTFSTYESGKSNVLEVSAAGERAPAPTPGAPSEGIAPLPTTVLSGTVSIRPGVAETVPAETAPPVEGLPQPHEGGAIEPAPHEITPPANPKAAAKVQLLLEAGNPGIGGQLSNESLNLIEQRYGLNVRKQVALARTQQDLDAIGRSLGTRRNEFVATVSERASVDLRSYQGQLVARSRGSGTTPGVDVFSVTRSGAPEITGVEVKIGASRWPYRQGASSMPNAYRVEETLRNEIMNVIRDKRQPIQVRARMKMALDAGAPIRWELDAYGNVRFKMRGNDIFPNDVTVLVQIDVPR
jgi:hypothetical protein